MMPNFTRAQLIFMETCPEQVRLLAEMLPQRQAKPVVGGERDKPTQTTGNEKQRLPNRLLASCS